MEEPNWKEVVLQSLEQRDARELFSSDIYEAYLKLATSYGTLQAEGSPGLPPPSAAGSKKYYLHQWNTSKFDTTLTDLNSEEAAHLKSQVAELYKAQNANLQTIKSLEDGLTFLQQAEKQLKQELSDLRTRRKDLELRAALHGETLREKNQQIQILQDELLMTGLSLTVLEEKMAKLEAEYKVLLERWLAKIKAEAETMNDANEFLERIRGMRMSSPVGGSDDPVGEEQSPPQE